MKFFYLIGSNTKGSLSHLIHKWIYDFFNIDASYLNQDIEELNFNDKMEHFFNDIKSGKIHGINITNPYKIKVISSKMSLSDDAKKIDAVNCIYKKDNKLIGENTDWYGFLKSLAYNNIGLKDYNIIIIGSGGASRSIVYSLQKEEIKNFQIYNRTNIDNFNINNNLYKILDLNNLQMNILPNSLIINCTPSGVIADNNILSNAILKNIKVFYDLNYHESKFHSILKDKDIQVIGGLDMLIYQAIKSIEFWVDKEIIDEIDISKIKKYVKESYKC